MTRRRSILRDGVTAFAALALLGLLALKLQDGANNFYSGRFQAVDGDTLRLGDVRVRLKGIDAPEYLQTCRRDDADWPCGREARRALSELVSGGPVECAGSGEDRLDAAMQRFGRHFDHLPVDEIKTFIRMLRGEDEKIFRRHLFLGNHLVYLQLASVYL